MTFRGRASDPWHEPTLSAPYTAGSPAPEYRVDDAGNVHLRGRITRNAAASAAVAFTLPSAYWPSVGERRRVAASPGTALARAVVGADGTVSLLDDSGTVVEYDIGLSFNTY